MVQRYDLKEDWVTGHIDLEEDADGDWVGYEDIPTKPQRRQYIWRHK